MNAPIRPPSPEDASPERIFRAILATDFRAFVEYVFGVLRPGTPFKPNWHIDAMAHKVSQVASGEVKRLIIAVPPRHLKSIIASVALPAWYLGHNPSERVVCVSYSAELAKTHANDFRRVVADVGDRRPARARWRRHAPAHHRQLAVIASIAHHRGRIVGEHSGHRRQVADVVVHRAEEGDDGGLVGGDRIEIAHAKEHPR
jgi:hypothetical protein